MSRPDLHLREQTAILQPTMATSSTPSLDPPAATPSIENAGPFMRAPREIRDNIYRFLLSTKHTKEFHGEPATASSAYSPNNPTEPGLIRYVGYIEMQIHLSVPYFDPFYQPTGIQ